MGAALAVLCLLGNKTRLALTSGIYRPQVWPCILIASLESLNHKDTKVLAQ